ncbi:MAG: hypothetical protein K0S14_411, partial [Thermomicrobiales bacterium]|nr:hypothetical protein [Thermomicrobiales bacterium]
LVTPDADQRLSLEPHAVALSAPPVAGQPTTTYRYLVVTCERFPEGVITTDQVESDDLPADSGSRCVRAPAGVLFHVHRDDGSGEIVLTDRHGKFWAISQWTFSTASPPVIPRAPLRRQKSAIGSMYWCPSQSIAGRPAVRNQTKSGVWQPETLTGLDRFLSLHRTRRGPAVG